MINYIDCSKSQTTEKRDNTNLASQLLSIIARMCHANLLSSGAIIYYLGAVPAAILFVLGLLVNALLLHYYIDAIYFTGANNISYLIYHIFRSRLVQVLFDIVVIVLPFGTLASYILTISKMIAQTIEHNSSLRLLKYNYALIVCVALLVIFPICCVKSPRVFAKIQPFSVVAALLYSIVLVVFGSRKVICSTESGVVFTNSILAFRSDKSGGYLFLDCLRYFPTIIFAINITVSVPIVHRDILGSPVLKRHSLRNNMAIGTLAVFAMFCVSGFSTAAFGHSTMASNLDSFGQCSMLLFDVLGLIYSIVLIVAYPLWLYPNRICIMQMIRVSLDNYWVFFALGFGIIVITMLLAMFVTNIQVIFGLFASFCGYFLYFVIPLSACLKLPYLSNYHALQQKELAKADEGLTVASYEYSQEQQNAIKWGTAVDIDKLRAKISDYQRNHCARSVFAIILLVLFAGICGVAFVMNILSFVK